jgi:hypothetical protein
MTAYNPQRSNANESDLEIRAEIDRRNPRGLYKVGLITQNRVYREEISWMDDLGFHPENLPKVWK